MNATEQDIVQAIEQGDHEALERLLAVEPGTDPNIPPLGANEGFPWLFPRWLLLCAQKDRAQCARVLVAASMEREYKNIGLLYVMHFGRCAGVAHSDAMLNVLEEYFFSKRVLEPKWFFNHLCMEAKTPLAIERYVARVDDQSKLIFGLNSMMADGERFEHLIVPYLDVKALSLKDHRYLLLQASQHPIVVVMDLLYHREIAQELIDDVRNHPDQFQGMSTRWLEAMVAKDQMTDALSPVMEQAIQTRTRVI